MSYLFCSHKYKRFLTYFIFEPVKKKFGPIYRNFYPKNWLGIRKKPDSRPRGEKGNGSRFSDPDPQRPCVHWSVGWATRSSHHFALDFHRSRSSGSTKMAQYGILQCSLENTTALVSFGCFNYCLRLTTWVLNVPALQTEVVKPEPNGDEHITLEGPEVTDDPAPYMEEVYHQVPLKSSQNLPRGKTFLYRS